MFDGGFTKAWRLQAKNTSQPNEEPVNLFAMHTTVVSRSRCPPCREAGSSGVCDAVEGAACSRCVRNHNATECIRRNQLVRDHGINFITDDVCGEQDRHLVIALGMLRIDIMNRVPVELDIPAWKTVDHPAGRKAPSHIRLFIDQTALSIWKQNHYPAVDLFKLGYYSWGEHKSMWVSHLLGQVKAPDITETSINRTTMPAVWAMKEVGSTNITNHTRIVKILVQFKGIDIKGAEHLEDLQTYGMFTLYDRDSEDKAERAAVRTLEHIIFELFGLVGAVKAIRDLTQDYRKMFMCMDEQETTRGMVVRGQRGPCDGGLFWAHPLAGPNLVNLNPATAVIKQLRITDESGEERPVQHNHININTVIRDRFCLGFIIQQSLIATSKGQASYKPYSLLVSQPSTSSQGYCTRRTSLHSTAHVATKKPEQQWNTYVQCNTPHEGVLN